MNKFVEISKIDLVKKFGLRYYITKDLKTMKDSIVEIFGDLSFNDIFETKYYSSIEEAFEKICNDLNYNLDIEKEVKKELEKKYKLPLFSKIYKKEKLEFISMYNNKIKTLEDKISKEDKDVIINKIPDFIYFPEIHFEYDKKYYIYQDIKSSKINKITELKVKNIEFFNIGNNIYSMTTTFVSEDNSLFTVNDKELHNYNGKYFIADYKNYYIFNDIDKAKSTISDLIENEIIALKIKLKYLNELK